MWIEVKARLDAAEVVSEAPLALKSGDISLIESTFDVVGESVTAQDEKLVPVVGRLRSSRPFPATCTSRSLSTPRGVFLLVARRTNGAVVGGVSSRLTRWSGWCARRGPRF